MVTYGTWFYKCPFRDSGKRPLTDQHNWNSTSGKVLNQREVEWSLVILKLIVLLFFLYGETKCYSVYSPYFNFVHQHSHCSYYAET